MIWEIYEIMKFRCVMSWTYIVHATTTTKTTASKQSTMQPESWIATTKWYLESRKKNTKWRKRYVTSLPLRFPRSSLFQCERISMRPPCLPPLSSTDSNRRNHSNKSLIFLHEQIWFVNDRIAMTWMTRMNEKIKMENDRTVRHMYPCFAYNYCVEKDYWQ